MLATATMDLAAAAGWALAATDVTGTAKAAGTAVGGWVALAGPVDARVVALSFATMAAWLSVAATAAIASPPAGTGQDAARATAVLALPGVRASVGSAACAGGAGGHKNNHLKLWPP